GEALDPCPERGEDPGGRSHVGAVAGSVDPALAGGQRGEDQRPVADRLVAWQPQLAAQAGACPDPGDRRLGRRRRVHPAAAPSGWYSPRTCSWTGTIAAMRS